MSERVIQFRVGVMVLATAIIAGILIVLFGDLPSLVQSTYPPGVTPQSPCLSSNLIDLSPNLTG